MYYSRSKTLNLADYADLSTNLADYADYSCKPTNFKLHCLYLQATFSQCFIFWIIIGDVFIKADLIFNTENLMRN